MAQPAPMPPPGPMPPPVARKTSPIVWILVAVVGIFVLGFVAVIGAGLFIAHKVARNPVAAAARLAALANKDVDVVGEDDDAGTITLRDKHTGKNVTVTFDQARNGKFSIAAEGEDGKTAVMEYGSGTGKLPSWVPAYPGASNHFNLTARGDGAGGQGEGGNFTFTTSDSPSKVLQFYQDKAKELGMEAKLTTTTADAGMVIATDDSNHRSLTAIVGGTEGNTTANVTYGSK